MKQKNDTIGQHLSIEHELLLNTTGAATPSGTIYRIKALSAQIKNWPAWMRSADYHGVFPLAGAHLKTAIGSDLPPDVDRVITDRLAVSVMRSNFLLQQLDEILRLFALHGIRTVPLKGPLFAAHFWHDPALRESSDLDLLVNPSDARRAWDILEKDEFATSSPYGIHQKEALMRFQPAVALYNNRRRLQVDLHWQPGHQPFDMLASERLWPRCREERIGDKRYLMLTDEDALLYCCAHGPQHKWERLRYVTDILAVLENAGRLDWDYITDAAVQSAKERILFQSLLLAHRLLGAPADKGLLSRAEQDPVVAQLCDIAAAGLAAKTEAKANAEAAEPASSQRIHRDVYAWNSLTQPGQKVRLLYERFVAPSPVEIERFGFPRGFFWIYYLVRPIRLIFRQLYKKGGRREKGEEPEIIALDAVSFSEVSKALLDQRIAVRFKARGGSMSPFIRTGDVLTVTKTNLENLRFGDVILFMEPYGRLLAHRLVRIKRTAEGHPLFRTRGDALFKMDPRFENNRWLGRVDKVEKKTSSYKPGHGVFGFLGAIWTACFPLGPLAILCYRKIGRKKVRSTRQID